MDGAELNFYLYHNTPMIDVLVWDNKMNKNRKLSMIFDTGAYLTIISYKIADTLGYTPIGKKVYVSSLAGSGEAYYTVIPELKSGDFSFGAVAALVTDFSEDMRSDAVLGMNVIKNFNTSIMFEDDSFRKGVIKMQPRFPLDEIKQASEFNYEHSRFGIWNIRQNF